MSNIKIERRSFHNLEFRTNEDNGQHNVSGYAVVFDQPSQDMGGWIEYISKDSITNETIQNSDVLFLCDHNPEKGVMARSKRGKGSLRMSIDDHGVKISADLDVTNPVSAEVWSGLSRGDIDSMSFAFVCDADEVDYQGDTLVRRVTAIRALYDVSAVYNPAYPSTELGIEGRSLEERKAMKEMLEKRAEEEGKKPEEKNDEEDNKEEKEEPKDNEDNKEEKNEEDNKDDKEEKSDEERAMKAYFTELRSKYND